VPNVNDAVELTTTRLDSTRLFSSLLDSTGGKSALSLHLRLQFPCCFDALCSLTNYVPVDIAHSPRGPPAFAVAAHLPKCAALFVRSAFLFSVSIYVAIAASPLLADVLLSFLVSAFFWVLNGVCRIEIGQMAGICSLWMDLCAAPYPSRFAFHFRILKRTGYLFGRQPASTFVVCQKCKQFAFCA